MNKKINGESNIITRSKSLKLKTDLKETTDNSDKNKNKKITVSNEPPPITDVDHFIYLEENNLPIKFCNEIIEKFIADDRKEKGFVFSRREGAKETMDLFITQVDDWKEIDTQLSKVLYNSLEKYMEEHISKISNIYDINDPIISTYLGNVVDFGYQVQHYKKNEGFYKWHCDFINNTRKDFTQVRLYTFIWYLNDVDEGGETEFLHGIIKPKAGKLLIFPSTITYYHRGRMPISSDKYIITGWIGYKIPGYI